MLPKVANQIIQHTSRAVTAVQNHALRNALQFQSNPSTPNNVGYWNSNPSSSGSGPGSGPGSGGAKFHSSRFNANYSVTGRAVVQADPSISSGTRGEPADEEDVHLSILEQRPVPQRTRHRSRSSSLSFTIQDQDALPKGSVLKAIQQHIRSRHSFASSASAISDKVEQQTRSASPRKALEAPSEADQDVSDDALAAQEAIIARIREATNRKDITSILVEAQNIHDAKFPLSTDVFNAALHGMYTLRQVGEPLRPIFRLYNRMVTLSVVPDTTTYSTLILALTDRDSESFKSLATLERRIHLYGEHPEANEMLRGRIERLKNENNFFSALALFQTACLIPRTNFSLLVHNHLLRSCAFHANVDAAVHVFKLLEKSSTLVPDIFSYHHLLNAYTQAEDISGAKQVFDAFLVASKADRVSAHPSQGDRLRRSAQIAVWNDMIVAYIRLGQPAEGLALLEQMMDSEAGIEFGLADVPVPAPVTFTRIIDVFCRLGDLNSALSWFDRLLQQPQQCGLDPFVPTMEPTKPEGGAWTCILQWLAVDGKLDEIRRLVDIARNDHLYSLRPVDRIVIARATLSHISAHPELSSADVVAQLEYLLTLTQGMDLIVSVAGHSPREAIDIFQDIVMVYLKNARPDRALVLVENLVQPLLLLLHHANDFGPRLFTHESMMRYLRIFLHDISAAFVAAAPVSGLWDIQQAVRLARVSEAFEGAYLRSLADHCLQTFASSTPEQRDTLTVPDWHVLFSCATLGSVESGAPASSLDVFVDGFSRGVRFADLPQPIVDSVIFFLHQNYELPALEGIAEQLELDLNLPPATVAPPEQQSNDNAAGKAQNAVISAKVSQYIDQFSGHTPAINPLEAYRRFEASAQNSIYPNAIVLGRLINVIGRLGHLDKVQILYDAAQRVLGSLENDKPAQSLGWFQVEDQMIIALAHAGNAEGAHVHRQRIVLHGGCPSADAYGVLIQNIKDTTDDTTNAMTLYEDAISRGVVPNTYLYNVVISKLAKARKADDALTIFGEMKARSMRPTSVTYGALIAACCRVGDATSAENLFMEMSAQPNFKPRVPPYNTMMQLYTQTKPDRERVLHFYDALVAANIHPTAHTYKLLLDAYGTIEPADTAAMEDVFARLLADRSVTVNGTHWASLINAYGCMQKDLDKAIALFDSIRQHSSTQRSGAALPDAVTFEALINVFVTLRRPDLIPVYVAKLSGYGIHMTAYIANLLIKGYAMSGDIGRAREVFESLVDPPEGVAAPNNHAPHDGQSSSSIPSNAPVYREPSTWEAMVRAELGNGNRDEAVDLLERVKARRFPPAVCNRISGIMLDDSVSPWSTTPTDATRPTTPGE